MTRIAEFTDQFITRMLHFPSEVFGGATLGIALKKAVGALIVAVVGMITNMLPVFLAYAAAIAIDAFFGAQIARRAGTFSAKRALFGPGEKILYSGVLFMATEILQFVIERTGVELAKPWVTIGLACWMCSALIVEAAGKYEKLNGETGIVAWLRERLNMKPKGDA